jgi:nitrate/nitrite-specific signal transduction histidine kinase
MSATDEKDDDGGAGAYVRRVSHDTLRLTEELMAENHRLRLEVASLQSVHADLVTGLRRAQAESERYAAQYRNLESQNTSLANLYVASYRLHGSLDRTDVLTTIQEIVTNLVGCEEMAIFETDEAGAALVLAAATGIDPDPLTSVPFGTGVIGRCAQTGETFVAADGDGPAPAGEGADLLSACVPLRLAGRVSGAIALFRLLPQKSGIEAVDRELFDLLATHAATALHCASLHARQASVAS